MQLYHSNITKNIFKNCDNFWEKIILENMDWKKVSWIEYKNLALFYAEKLLEKNIKIWDSVVIFVKDIIDFSAWSLAVLLVWAKIVIIEPDYSEKILKEKLEFIKPDLVIIEKNLFYLLKTPFLRNISKIKKYKYLLKYSKNIILSINKKNIQINKKFKFKNIDKDLESLVVFTWWTTWNPKWVVHTLESLEIMFQRIIKIIWNKTKIFYADLPHFVLMWINMWVKTIIWKNNLEDRKFLKILEKYKIDTTFSPPYRYVNFLSTDSFYHFPKTLKHILLGSAPIYKSFLEKLEKNIDKETKITCIYWMTEILPVAFIDWREKINTKVDWDILWKIIDWINIEFADDWELILSWKWLFKKYLWWENIKKHFTWDIVEYKNWNLIMKARKKDMILRKDYNIYPSLYEPIINSFDWIKESALVWIFDEKLQDEKIILFIEWKKINLEKLKQVIDEFAFPDKIIYVDKIPRIWRQNKIDKNFLRDNYRKLKHSVDL